MDKIDEEKSRRYKPSIMTLPELAKYIRVHKSTVYRMLKQNRIPAIKVGNQWRFKKERIDQWLETNGMKTSSDIAEERQ
ncbi:MAG: helix-turn-helix domain-containing protein [Candidatus Aminicenantes bacterium]|nr:helix-turn-helix domain-containing protein [Candidatus Aminicenantes bacterium]MDH5714045.1 helix-turn-helix domain-containing protein [Candidatus Aminicenantes bacterium]